MGGVQRAVKMLLSDGAGSQARAGRLLAELWGEIGPG